MGLPDKYSTDSTYSSTPEGEPPSTQALLKAMDKLVGIKPALNSHQAQQLSLPYTSGTTTSSAWSSNKDRYLPRFKEGTHCSKCLFKSLKIQFCDGKRTSLIDYTPADGNCDYKAVYKDHLHLCCDRCGYKWLMWAADVEADDEKPSPAPGGEL